MKRKRSLVMFVLCSVLAMVVGTATTYAEGPALASIESHVIQSEDGSLVTDGTLMAGSTYTVAFEINVGVVPENTILSLSTPMERKGDVYWSLKNPYPGVDTESWQPGRSTIEFDAVQGLAQFTVIGSVPSDYTTEKLSIEEWDKDEVLHFARGISLVELSLGEQVVDGVSAEVLDHAIVTYEQTLTEKENLLEKADADPKYVGLAGRVIELAEGLSEKGYVEDATALLDSLPSSVSGFPIAVSEKSSVPYLIGIVVLALILIVSVGLFLRARSNSSFIRQQVDEEAGRLDVLSVRISKIDKLLGRDIEQVKEQLERISGR